MGTITFKFWQYMLLCFTAYFCGVGFTVLFATKATSSESHAVYNYLDDVKASPDLFHRFNEVNDRWTPSKIALAEIMLDAAVAKKVDSISLPECINPSYTWITAHRKGAVIFDYDYSHPGVNAIVFAHKIKQGDIVKIADFKSIGYADEIQPGQLQQGLLGIQYLAARKCANDNPAAKDNL